MIRVFVARAPSTTLASARSGNPVVVACDRAKLQAVLDRSPELLSAGEREAVFRVLRPGRTS